MEEKILTINGKDEKTFLKAYNHDYNSVAEIGLDWAELVELHDYYATALRGDLELKAGQIFNDLRFIKGAYIIKYRTKDPEHLIDKVIRKKIEKDKKITKANFEKEIDDLIGLRILHLFKNDWELIYQAIKSKYPPKEKPVAYYRKGDDEFFIKHCKEIGLSPKIKNAGYRSIHYIAVIPTFGKKFKCEIQLRTVFEDAWSEIDHLVRYPNFTDNDLMNQYLLIFNRLAGAADDMGTFLMAMKNDISKLHEERTELKSIVEELREETIRLEGENDKKSDKIEELKKRLDKSIRSSWPFFQQSNVIPSTLDYITQIQNPSGLTFSDSVFQLQKSLMELNHQQELMDLQGVIKHVNESPKIKTFEELIENYPKAAKRE